MSSRRPRRRGGSSRQRAIPKPEAPRSRDRLFLWSAAGALLLHGGLLFATGPLQGGADLKPHLRLIQLMGEEPGLRSVYAPAFHAVGALLAAVIGPAAAVKLVALAGAGALIAGFRCFQRAAGLPEAAAALFAWAPYGFALSWCLPKLEAAGYGLAFAGLGLLLRRRERSLALVLGATFLVHTGAALFLGLCGGVLALATGNRRALAALAAGCLLASPLLAAHLAAGCTPAQALLLSRGDYLRAASGWSSLAVADRVIVLAGPISLVLGALGAGRLWREHRPIAVVSLVALALYTNELWLAPFGARTTLNLLRGLTVLALPACAAAGAYLAGRRRLAAAATAACAVWALGSAWLALPGSCHRAPVELAELEALEVDRCTFRWAVRSPR